MNTLAKNIYALLFLFSTAIYGQTASSELTNRFTTIAEKENMGYANVEAQYRELVKICVEKKEYNVASLCYANLGHMYQRKGNFEKATANFKQGIEIGKKANMKSGLASNLGALGMTYQEMGFSKEAKNYINQGISILENSDDSDISKNITLGNLYSVLSFLNLSTTEKKFTKPESLKIRLSLVEKSLEYYRKTPRAYNKRSVGYINLAAILQDMGHYDPAIKALNQAFENNVKKNPRTYSRIYLGLAMSYQGKKRYDSVIHYGNKFLETGDQNDYIGHLTTYESLFEAYTKINNTKLADYYHNKYLFLDNKLNKNKLKSVTKEYEQSSEEKKELKGCFIKIISLSAFVLLILIVVLIYQNRKYKSQKKKFLNFRNYLSESKTTADSIDNKPTTKITELIHNDTEVHILKGLEEFEAKLQFTKKGITLGGMAAELQTNVRYLSEIIKKHKSENFTTYINTLRINYITQKIESDPLFQKYKISYLAELGGFATSPAFTKIFKEVTGMTPSSYLRLLAEEKKSDKNAN